MYQMWLKGRCAYLHIKHEKKEERERTREKEGEGRIGRWGGEGEGDRRGEGGRRERKRRGRDERRKGFCVRGREREGVRRREGRG